MPRIAKTNLRKETKWKELAIPKLKFVMTVLHSQRHCDRLCMFSNFLSLSLFTHTHTFYLQTI